MSVVLTYNTKGLTLDFSSTIIEIVFVFAYIYLYYIYFYLYICICMWPVKRAPPPPCYVDIYIARMHVQPKDKFLKMYQISIPNIIRSTGGSL